MDILALLAEDGGQRLPLVRGKEASLSRVVHNPHRIVQLLAFTCGRRSRCAPPCPPTTCRTCLRLPRSRSLPPRRPFWPPANVTARLTLHPRQQVLFGRAQVHDHVGLVVQVVAGPSGSRSHREMLRILLLLEHLPLDLLDGVRQSSWPSPSQLALLAPQTSLVGRASWSSA